MSRSNHFFEIQNGPKKEFVHIGIDIKSVPLDFLLNMYGKVLEAFPSNIYIYIFCFNRAFPSIQEQSCLFVVIMLMFCE